MKIKRNEIILILAISLLLASLGLTFFLNGMNLVSSYTELEMANQLKSGYYNPSVYSSLENAKNILKGKNYLLTGAGLLGVSIIPIAIYFTCKWIRGLIDEHTSR